MARGYSYVQMLMVIALLAILAAVASPYYLRWQQGQQLRSVSAMLAADLRYVQSRAMQREHGDTWGIYIEDSQQQYSLFRGASYTPGDPYNQTISYPDSVTLNASPSPTIAFSGLTGTVPTAVTITISSTSLPTDSKMITINEEGLVTP